MPAYSFQQEFCPYVEEGSKLHTVRNLRIGRSGHAQPGETVYLYYAQRTKYCRKLAEGICTKTEDITITAQQIFINRSALSPSDMNAFAWRDGFRPAGSSQQHPGASWAMMRDFWLQFHPEVHNIDGWKGIVIHWTLKKKSDWVKQEAAVLSNVKIIQDEN